MGRSPTPPASSVGPASPQPIVSGNASARVSGSAAVPVPQRSVAQKAAAAAAASVSTAPSKIPTSAGEFMRQWKGAKGVVADQARLLQMFPPVQLPKLLGSEVSEDLVVGIAKSALHIASSGETGTAWGLMEALSQANRLGLALAFLSSGQKKIVADALSAVKPGSWCSEAQWKKV